MKGELKNLWNLSNEIEGLILLTDHKNMESCKEILSLIKNKVDSLSNEINKIVEAQDDHECNLDFMNSIVLESEEDMANGNIEDDYMPEGGEPEDERANGNLDDDYSLPEISDDENEQTESVRENAIDEEQCSDADIVDVDENIDDVDYEISDFDAEQEVGLFEDEIIVDAQDDTMSHMTIKDKISINESKDLRQAFTLNDKYRFRRELFGNSEIEMGDTINLVSAMSSYAEAEEYFYDDLDWDATNDEVVDFMAIIANHFASK